MKYFKFLLIVPFLFANYTYATVSVPVTQIQNNAIILGTQYFSQTTYSTSQYYFLDIEDSVMNDVFDSYVVGSWNAGISTNDVVITKHATNNSMEIYNTNTLNDFQGAADYYETTRGSSQRIISLNNSDPSARNEATISFQNSNQDYAIAVVLRSIAVDPSFSTNPSKMNDTDYLMIQFQRNGTDYEIINYSAPTGDPDPFTVERTGYLEIFTPQQNVEILTPTVDLTYMCTNPQDKYNELQLNLQEYTSAGNSTGSITTIETPITSCNGQIQSHTINVDPNKQYRWNMKMYDSVKDEFLRTVEGYTVQSLLFNTGSTVEGLNEWLGVIPVSEEIGYTQQPCSITQPVGCIQNAFVWAFVPSSETLNKLSSLTLKDKAPVSYIYEVQALFETLTTQANSQEFEMTVNTPIGDITFIDQTMINNVPFIPFMRTILTALVYFFGAWTLYAIARRTF